MFLKTATLKSTKSCWDSISRLKKALDECEAVVIGAGAGLSTAAGFTYSGGRFKKFFSDFIDKYGFRDMYSAGFYPFETPEEHWAYWSRYIMINRYSDPPLPVYDRLLSLAADKNYFVITTNVDHCFQRAGFDKKRLFYTQGDYGLFQCSKPCCSETFDNEDIIRQMYSAQKNMKIPSELIPVCPHCGRPLTMNLRADDTFVQDSGWYKASKSYSDFLRTNGSGRILYLELGVGFNTPVIIKYPFIKLTAENPHAVYACVNLGEAYAPDEIAERSVVINSEIGEVIQTLSSL